MNFQFFSLNSNGKSKYGMCKSFLNEKRVFWFKTVYNSSKYKDLLSHFTRKLLKKNVLGVRNIFLVFTHPVWGAKLFTIVPVGARNKIGIFKKLAPSRTAQLKKTDPKKTYGEIRKSEQCHARSFGLCFSSLLHSIQDEERPPFRGILLQEVK